MLKRMLSMALCTLLFVFSSVHSQLSLSKSNRMLESLTQEELVVLEHNIERFEEIFPAIFENEVVGVKETSQALYFGDNPGLFQLFFIPFLIIAFFGDAFGQCRECCGWLRRRVPQEGLDLDHIK